MAAKRKPVPKNKANPFKKKSVATIKKGGKSALDSIADRKKK